MGSNKALLPRQGMRFIEWIHRTLQALFHEVLVVTNSPEQYPFLPCRMVPDLYPGKGVLGGIHSGLAHSGTAGIFVAACDMPYLNPELIRNLCNASSGADLVIPRTEHGYEPLHAVYREGCLPALEELLREPDNSRVISLLSHVKVREFSADEVAAVDPAFRSFVNVNTPEEYFRLRSGRK
jgi:FdhD protein